MPRARRKDAPRYASGRINYNELARDEAALRPVLEWRARFWGVPMTPQWRPFLLDAKQGYAVGRMRLASVIDEDQHTAGCHVWRVVEAYRRLVLGMSGWPAAPRMEMLPEVVQAADDDAQTGRGYETLAERVLRVTNRYMQLEGCLLSVGKTAREAVLSACVEDSDAVAHEPLRTGLDAVFREFGLG